MLKISQDQIGELLNIWAKALRYLYPREWGHQPVQGLGRPRQTLTLGEGNALEPPKDLSFPGRKLCIATGVRDP